jgi:hypothetical protein
MHRSSHDERGYEYRWASTNGRASVVCTQVKQVRTAAGYEKMVLRINDWMVEQGYTPFCHVVEV